MAAKHGTSGSVGRAKLPPALKNKYDAVRILGRGRLGSLFAARQRELERPVIIRVFDPRNLSDRSYKARIERAVSAWGRVEHPNIVSLIDVDAASPPAWIVVEHVDGMPLRDHWSEDNPPSVGQVLVLMADVASALEAAAAVGLVHGGLTPECILVTSDASPLVTDFGASPPDDAPSEAKSKNPSPAVDVYALASMLCEVLTGVVPAMGSDPSVALTDAVPDLPRDFCRLVHRALSSDPNQRPSAAELAQELTDTSRLFVDGIPSAVRKGSTRTRRTRRPAALSVSARVAVAPVGSSPSPWRLRIAAAVFVIAVIGVVVGSAISTWRTPVTGGLRVESVGSSSALIAWSLNPPAPRVMVRVRHDETDRVVEMPVESLLPRGQEPDPEVGHMGIVTDLEPQTRYHLSLALADGRWSLERQILTDPAAPFEPRKRIQLESTGIVVSFSSARSMSVRINPPPDEMSSESSSALPVFARRHRASWTWESARRQGEVGITFRTLSGEEHRIHFEPLGAVQAALDEVVAAIEESRQSGWFAACFTSQDFEQGSFLRRSGQSIGQLEEGSKEWEAEVARVWDLALDMLRRTEWFERLEPLLPGLLQLVQSPIADDGVLDSAAQARAALLLIRRTAEWYDVPPYRPWEPLLSPASRPRPMSVGEPFLQGDDVQAARGRILSLASRPVYLMFDSTHPVYRGVFTSTLAREMTAGRAFSVDLSQLDLSDVRQAEVQISLRTAVLPIVLAVHINDRYTAMLEDPPDDVERYVAWRRESGANVREVEMMMSGDFGASDRMQETLETLEQGVAPDARLVFHRIPVSALKAGTNRVSLEPWVGPLDTLEYVAADRVVIRVSP